MTLAKYEDTNLPTPKEIRSRWCFGLPLAKEDGQPMTDPDIQAFIDAKVDEMERRIGIPLKPTVIASNPEARGLVKGVDYDKEEPPYDYEVRKWMNYGFLQLRERPVQKVTGFRLVLPNGLVIVDFMANDSRKKWVKLYPDAGQIHLVPYAGDPTLFAMMGGSQSGYPFVTGTINSNLPQMIEVDYVAGYELGAIPRDIRDMVAKMTAVEILGIAGDAVLVGISSMSTSIDGLSESLSTTASATSATYGAHIKQFQDEIDAYFDPRKGAVRSSERGITFTGL